MGTPGDELVNHLHSSIPTVDEQRRSLGSLGFLSEETTVMEPPQILSRLRYCFSNLVIYTELNGRKLLSGGRDFPLVGLRVVVSGTVAHGRERGRKSDACAAHPSRNTTFCRYHFSERLV